MRENFSIILRDKRFVLGLLFLVVLVGFVLSSRNNPNPPDHGPGGAQESAIVSLLPITNVKGPYAIEYVETVNGVDHIKIADSSPSGREAALDWLRAQGVDIGRIDITFEDYSNPFVEVPRNE